MRSAIKPDAVHLAKAVNNIDVREDGVTLYFADGTHAQGDLLVGADGVKSTVRRCLFGDDEAQFTGMIAWRAVIPMDRLPERLRDMLGWTWIGPGGIWSTIPCAGAN
jgi:salicylate hydroxylase